MKLLIQICIVKFFATSVTWLYYSHYKCRWSTELHE